MKILLKIWPALTPILLYILWQYVLKKLINRFYKTKSSNNNSDAAQNNKEKIIEGKFEDIGNKNQPHQNNVAANPPAFSLHNKNFVIVLYISLILAIICLISFAF